MVKFSPPNKAEDLEKNGKKREREDVRILTPESDDLEKEEQALLDSWGPGSDSEPDNPFRSTYTTSDDDSPASSLYVGARNRCS